MLCQVHLQYLYNKSHVIINECILFLVYYYYCVERLSLKVCIRNSFFWKFFSGYANLFTIFQRSCISYSNQMIFVVSLKKNLYIHFCFINILFVVSVFYYSIQSFVLCFYILHGHNCFSYKKSTFFWHWKWFWNNLLNY